MSYRIIPTPRFEKELKRLAKKFPSLKQEFGRLIAEISEKPETGTFVGNSCFKIRLAIASKGKGKSGGARVLLTCTWKWKQSICSPFMTRAKKLILNRANSKK